MWSRHFAVIGLLALPALASACGPIRGELIEGSGGDARPAANLPVTILASPDARFRRCEAIREADERIRSVRMAFADSIYRATRTTPDGPSRADQRVTFNVRSYAYGGDPARTLVAARDSMVRTLPVDVIVWSGRTDGAGKFSSRWLPAGNYLVYAGSAMDYADAGIWGARWQGTHRGYILPVGCEPTP